MDQAEQYQNLLDESYSIIFEIDQYILNDWYRPREDSFKKINEYYNFVMQKKSEFHFKEDNKWKEYKADELTSNYFLATLYLYFIYKIFNERLGDHTKQVKNLAQKIIAYTSKIPEETISNISERNHFLLGEFEKIKNDITFIIENYDVFTNATSYFETTRFENFSILANYCKYSEKKQILYKKINDAIISNKDSDIWLSTLSLSAYIHKTPEKNFFPSDEIKETNTRNKVYNIEKNVLSLAEQILDCKNIQHFDAYNWQARNESSDSFEKKNKKLLNILLSLDSRVHGKWPCISFLLYKAIAKMPYHKCKEFFTESTLSSRKNDDNIMNFRSTLQDLEKYSSTEFKGVWAQTRIQNMMFFAIADFSDDEYTIKEALDNGTWSTPETQKSLLNDILSKNKIPPIEKSFDISQWNDEAFSATETALNLLYNTIHYNESKFSSGIIQQINFVDEQRSRLFHYQDVKPTDRPIEKDKPKSNADKPRFFNQFCQQSRDNLETEIKTMASIDCGFQLPPQAHVLPTYNQKIFVRQQKCKIFLETDTACNLPQEDFYRNRYKNMLHTRYIYPARNMHTHYSKYKPTENLLDEQNFDNLILFEYDIKTRLQKEQQLRTLKHDLDIYSIGVNSLYGGFFCLRSTLDNLRKLLSNIVKSPKYKGNLEENDVKKVKSFESSKEILDILYEIQNNYPKDCENGKKMSDHIQYFETHHPDIYCLLKDIISQKEYSGNINAHLLEEMCHSCHPSVRIYQLYYTLSDIRRDYHVNDALAKELDEKIVGFKKVAIIIPQENTEQLLKSFKEVELFFVQNKDAYVKVVNEALEQNDFKKSYDYTLFLEFFLEAIQDVDPKIKNVFWNVRYNLNEESKNPQGKAISEDAKKNILNTLEIVFTKLVDTPLTHKLEICINSNDLKGISTFIGKILDEYEGFSSSTDLHLSESIEFIRYQINLYQIKIIKETADKIKDILCSFDIPAEELAIYDSSKLQEFIENRNFSDFISSEEQMMQIIDKYILFHYKKDDYSSDLFFRNVETPIEHIVNICNNRIDTLQKLIKEKKIDELKRLINHIYYKDLPNIQIDQNRYKYYKKYLDFLDKLDGKCKNIQNNEMHLSIEKVYNKVAEIRKDVETPYHKDSIKIFEQDEIYSSFLINESIDFLLNTIKYCTRSQKICEELKNKVLLNSDGRLGLTLNAELSKDIYYPEIFKKNLRLFLNTIFGVDNICTISDKKTFAEFDNVYDDVIVERNVHFFDQYSSLIILYLIRVTVELAHVKKIEI